MRCLTGLHLLSAFLLLQQHHTFDQQATHDRTIRTEPSGRYGAFTPSDSSRPSEFLLLHTAKDLLEQVGGAGHRVFADLFLLGSDHLEEAVEVFFVTATCHSACIGGRRTI